MQGARLYCHLHKLNLTYRGVRREAILLAKFRAQTLMI